MVLKFRLYLRLIGLAFKAVRRPAGGNWADYQEIFSEAEAIHRDLGHRYSADRILPRHRGPSLL